MGALLEKGYWKTDDVGLLYRAMDALRVYRVAQTFKQNQNDLSNADWEIVVAMNGEISPLAKRPKRVFKKV